MNIQWKDVGVNFNDTNSAMANAREGLSKAGTVFGEMRKSILDEEQRAIENAHRQKVFDENVRQFGLQHALNQDKLTEQIRANQANEANTRRGQDLNYKSSMANVGVQNARLAFEQSKWNILQSEKEKDRQTLASIADNLFASRNELDKKITDTQTLLDQTTNPVDKAKLESTLGILKQERTGMSATSLDNQYRIDAARRGINVKETPFTPEAALEQDRLKAAKAANLKAEEIAQKNALEATKIIRDLNLTPGQQELAHKVLLKAKQLYPNVPDNVLANALAKTPTYNAWWNWSGQNAFDYDNGEVNVLQDFIDGRNLNSNLFNQALATESIKFMRNNQKK